MANILLLYDMTERDFARDLKDLLEELNIGKVKMIPVSTNKGLTLEEKEQQYFDEADGALFLITPGSKRFDDIYPSPSVNHEMGQAKQKFAGMSQNVIYLVDGECNLPVIDQKARIVFNRKDIRSVVVALTQVIQDLKAAGLFRTAPIPTEIKPEPKTITLEEIVNRLNGEREGVLLEISNRLDGRISDTDLNKFLIEKLKFDMRSVNFIKRDLESLGFLLHYIADKPPYFNLWLLKDLGWKAVRYIIKKKKEEERRAMNSLADFLQNPRLAIEPRVSTTLLRDFLSKDSKK